MSTTARCRSLVVALAVLVGALALLIATPQHAHAQSPIHVDDTINDGLVVHFKFDEAASPIRDTITRTLTAALPAGVVLAATVPPAISVPNPGALSLNGTNGVTVTASAATGALDQVANSLTLAAWVRRPVTGTEVTIFQNGVGAQSWFVAITGDNRVRLQYGGTSIQTSPVAALNALNTWTHVAVAFNRTGSAIVRVFVNSGVVLQGTPSIPAAVAPTGNKAIGARDSNTLRFNGLIDDLRVYNRVLTNTEVTRLAQGKGCVFDGLSWATAIRELQCGLVEVAANGQIWVAQGTYLPSYNREVSFASARNMSILGGFVGTESSPAQRPPFNPQAPLTTLTGDAWATMWASPTTARTR